MMFLLRQIFRELFAERTRMILTILAIAWGTFAIASMLAVGEGLRLTFSETLANTGRNLLIVTGGETSKPYRGLHANVPVNLKKTDYEAISALPNIASISPQYKMLKMISFKDELITRQILSVNQNFAHIHAIPIEPGGRFISLIDMKRRNAVIVLGTKAAEDLFKKHENPVGQIVEVAKKPFLVIGVMKHKTQMVAFEAPDSFLSWIPATTYESLTNPQKIDAISISYKDPALLKQTQKRIRQIVAVNHNVNPSDESITNFSEFEKREKTVNNFFIGMQIFLGIIGILTLLVAAVGIANVMYASISRATKQIGLRMAIGARTYHIVMHYIVESLFATLIGGAMGVMMTVLLVYGFRFVPLKGKLIEAIGTPRPVLSGLVLVIVVLVLGLIGVLAGLFPALKAARVDPSEALIYE